MKINITVEVDITYRPGAALTDGDFRYIAESVVSNALDAALDNGCQNPFEASTEISSMTVL